jgi:peroxiredoxin
VAGIETCFLLLGLCLIGPGQPRTPAMDGPEGGTICGLVQQPDGSPAREGSVYLIRQGEAMRLVNGEVPELFTTSGARKLEPVLRSMISPEGRFSLPPEMGQFLLVAVGDTGFVSVRRGSFRGDQPLRLRAWARVTGSVKVDGLPVADITISADPEYGRAASGPDDEPRLELGLSTKTDEDGRFELTRVIPGRLVIGQWVPNGVRGSGRWYLVSLATVEVEGGRSYDLRIGQRGRPVVGRLAIPRPGEWLIREASIQPRGPAGRPHAVGVRIFPDGRFRAEDLKAGDHVLRIDVHEQPANDACGWARLIGLFSREFTVRGSAADGPLDIGRLEPSQVGAEPLRIGERAPDFRVRTLDGKLLSLSDFRGKFLLLDFWATWCAPCVSELPSLRALHESYRDDPRFSIVSLSLDERPDALYHLVKDAGLAWPQALLGPNSPIAAAYGATAIPATFLIGRDSRIADRDLRGSSVKEAVARALGQ